MWTHGEHTFWGQNHVSVLLQWITFCIVCGHSSYQSSILSLVLLGWWIMEDFRLAAMRAAREMHLETITVFCVVLTNCQRLCQHQLTSFSEFNRTNWESKAEWRSSSPKLSMHNVAGWMPVVFLLWENWEKQPKRHSKDACNDCSSVYTVFGRE